MALFGAAAILLASCGGGTDVAPSQPVVDGQGLGAASLASLDLGETSLVDGGVSGFQNAIVSADEIVTVRPDGFIILSNGSISNPVVVLTPALGGPPFCQGTDASCFTNPTCGANPCDFRLRDGSTGLIEVNPTGTIPPSPAQLRAVYTFNARYLTLNVGLTFPAGQFVSIDLFNLPPGATAPFPITAVEGSAPGLPYPPAFDVTVQTGLTSSGQSTSYIAVQDPSNLLTLTDIDLTNEANPCVAGNLSVMVRSDADPTPVPLNVSFETPGC